MDDNSGGEFLTLMVMILRHEIWSYRAWLYTRRRILAIHKIFKSVLIEDDVPRQAEYFFILFHQRQHFQQHYWNSITIIMVHVWCRWYRIFSPLVYSNINSYESARLSCSAALIAARCLTLVGTLPFPFYVLRILFLDPVEPSHVAPY